MRLEKRIKDARHRLFPLPYHHAEPCRHQRWRRSGRRGHHRHTACRRRGAAGECPPQPSEGRGATVVPLRHKPCSDRRCRWTHGLRGQGRRQRTHGRHPGLACRRLYRPRVHLHWPGHHPIHQELSPTKKRFCRGHEELRGWNEGAGTHKKSE